MDMEKYSAVAQMQKGLEGLRGECTFFKTPNVAPKMTFRDGYPDSVKQSLQSKPAPSIPMNDPWMYRRPSGR